MALDPRLFALLCCPVCRGPLRELPDDGGLACDACFKLYPIVDGIPVLLVEEAGTLRP